MTKTTLFFFSTFNLTSPYYKQRLPLTTHKFLPVKQRRTFMKELVNTPPRRFFAITTKNPIFNTNTQNYCASFSQLFHNTTMYLYLENSLNKKIMHHRRFVVVLLPLLKPPLPPPLKQKQRISRLFVLYAAVLHHDEKRERLRGAGAQGGGQQQRGDTTTPAASSHTHTLYTLCHVSTTTFLLLESTWFFFSTSVFCVRCQEKFCVFVLLEN